MNPTTVALIAWCLALCAAWGPTRTAAQEAAGAPSSIETIERRLTETAEDPNLGDAEKARLRSLYQQALAEIESAAQWRAAALDFARRAASARTELQEMEAALDAPPGEPPPISETDSLDILEQRRAEAESRLSEAAARLREADAEPLGRTSRRAAIRESLAGLADEAARIEDEPETSAASDADAFETDARRTLRAAQRLRLESRTAALQRELAAYDAERPLLPYRRELAAREAARLQEEAARLAAAADALRRLDASQQANEARLLAIQLGINLAAEPAEGTRQLLLTLAAVNNELTARRQSLVHRLDTAEQRLESLRGARADLEDRFTRTRERVAAIGRTSAVGLLLQRHRDSLPDDIRHYREERRTIEQGTRLVQEEIFDLDERRLLLADIETRAAELLAGSGAAGDSAGEQVAASVRSMLETQRTYLGLLFDDQTRYFDVHVQLGTIYGELHGAAEAFLRFIDERVLWTRNAETFAWSDLESARAAAAWLSGPGAWSSAARALANDAAHAPWRYAAMFAVMLALPWVRRGARSALKTCGRHAASGSATRYGVTARSLLLTLAIAATGPTAAWLIARRLAAAGDGAGFMAAAAAGLVAMAAAYLPLETLRQASRPHSLMVAHFGWPARAVGVLGRHLRWFAVAVLPFVFVLAAVSSQENQVWEHALGRLALVGLQLVSAVFITRVLHPSRGVFGEYLATHRGSWPDRLRNVWFGAAVCVPLVLAGVAVAGYMYAANELAFKSLETLWLATGVTIAYGMVSRRVLISRRSLSFRQRRERALAEEGAAAEPAPDLDQIDADTRRLVRSLTTAAAVGAIWLVWSDMVPALRVLGRVTLWPPGAAPDAAGAFTLEHLGLALVLAALTVVLARNVPALLEMVLLGLPVQPGARYALTSMSRYVLVFGGALAIFGILGVTWASVQWLVAAIGVGLGFGLQEIFANFVSGLLLLMERPVRVGDTITVGGVTGTVTRIRMRATTIQDWDLKELVVPNKDLVTGHLLNWTLSDAANRVTVLVGVAYGSDVDRVTRVLQEIVAATPLVLEAPEPLVTFEEFGDSALKFSIRAYVSDVEERLPAIHVLHTAIARRFGEEDIEIAFPQMDIHVRSTTPQRRDETPEPLRVAGASR